jgi:hypothetical protein
MMRINVEADGTKSAWFCTISRLPFIRAYASMRRLGHASLSLPASPSSELALVSLMQVLATEGRIGQAYIASWDGDDEPKGMLYEPAADIHGHQKPAQGRGTRYLRAVTDHLWLGPEFAAMLPFRAPSERVPAASQIGNARRSSDDPRRRGVSLEPMLASQADSQAFWGRFKLGRPQSQ